MVGHYTDYAIPTHSSGGGGGGVGGGGSDSKKELSVTYATYRALVTICVCI
jgi:hypothetical protein